MSCVPEIRSFARDQEISSQILLNSEHLLIWGTPERGDHDG